MITREIAGQLYGNNYRLVDKEGDILIIESAHDGNITCYYQADTHPLQYVDVYFEQIGVDYFVLCRPYSDLTKEIKPGVVPLVECAKIAIPSKKWHIKDSYVENENGNTFIFYEGDFIYYVTFSRQIECFNYLMRLHFPINLPDGTWEEITI